MSFVLLAVSVALLALPGLVRRIGRRLEPMEWARLAVASLAIGAASLELALVLLGVPTIVKMAGNPGLAAACRRLLGALAPGGGSVGWSAIVLAAIFPMVALRALRRAQRQAAQMRIEPWLGEHRQHGEIDLVVLPTPMVVAYSVAGPAPQIVLSAGLLAGLASRDPGELNAILRHERAHLRHHHQRILIGLGALEQTLPPTRWSTNAVRAALERWADEHAAADSPAARAETLNALVRVTDAVAAEPAIAAFTTLATLVERVDALAAPPPVSTWSRRVTARALIATLGLASLFAVVTWIAEAHMMLAMVGRCTM